MFIQNGLRHDADAQLPAVTDPDLAKVLKHTAMGPVDFYPINSTIYGQGDSVGPLYLVEFGTVRVCRITSDGRRQITAFYFAGDVFGFDPGREHQCYAESVDGAGIRTLRVRSGDLSAADGLLQLALRSIAKVQSHLLLLGRASASERLARFLLNLMEQQDSDETVALQMQRIDIGDYLGLTFETVSRALRVLKDRGLVRLPSADRVVVLDRERLAGLCI